MRSTRRVKKKIATARKTRSKKTRAPRKARTAARRTKTKPRPAKKSAPAKRAPRIDREALAEREREVRRLRAARRKLEERLTAAVQEIGTLRHYEIRAQMLENELASRDAELARLRAQASDRLGGASIVSAPAGASN